MPDLLPQTLRSLSNAQLRQLAVALAAEADQRVLARAAKLSGSPAAMARDLFDDRDAGGYRLSAEKRRALEGPDTHDAFGYRKENRGQE
jgi:hypothetical protein